MNIVQSLCLCLFIGLFSHADAQKIDHLEKMKEGDTLRITYIAGDEAIEFHEMLVVRANSGLTAVRKAIPLYNVKNPGPDWIKPLDRSGKKQLNGFINEALRQRKGDYMSSWSEDLAITLNSNTIVELIGNFEWGTGRYFGLEHALFGKEFKALEDKREKLNRSISPRLLGTWTVTWHLPELNDGKGVLLQRKKQADAKCAWTFGKKGHFSHVCQEEELWYLKKYTTHVNNGDMFLVLEPELERVGGYVSLKNGGATYKIISITPEEIILEFMW